ncbi:SMC5-SMC6 complex localization factor protein 1 [Excalfactoria chinensis]|uniref:SMC5-SMC6 complex localization factor protein 1 n=1 Tax=Excalfactoria chinensis TaxID=46218 RepID=UPI003B3AD18C
MVPSGRGVRVRGGGRGEASPVRTRRKEALRDRSAAGLRRPALSARPVAVAGGTCDSAAAPGVSVASGGRKRIIQFTGFRDKEKRALREMLLRLDCVFVDNKKYRNCTHLIAKKLCKSEKFLAACAAGKWILTKEYIINSAESGRWLDETTYEWGYKIEKDTHYSPQMQSAPKRWRKELENSDAPGAFYRWKVILAVKEGYEGVAPIRRVLEAGKATVCSSQNVESDVTHVFVLNKFFPVQKEKCLSEAKYYPFQYVGDYLLEEGIQNTEVTQINGFLPAQETDQNKSNMQLIEMKNAVIRHMYFVEAAKHKFVQKDFLNRCNPKVKNTNLSRGRLYVFEELIEEHLLSEVIMELSVGQKYSLPPVPLFHSLLEHVLWENTDAVLCAKLRHVLDLVLQHDPPWKSTSMLGYYLDLLQCPVCKKGTWNLIEMLVRSCLYCRNICHAVPVSGKADEWRTVLKMLLKFFFDLVKAEVKFLTKSLVEETNSQHQQVMPQTVLLKTFWLESETSVLFTKHINILVDWVILSYRELERRNDAFRREIACLLNGILGTVVDYWIVSGFLMDRNVFHQIANDLAHYIAIACDDVSICDFKALICSIPSLWLQMFVAEAVFKKMCLQRNVTISTEPLSLQKIVGPYFHALREVEICETRKIHKAKKIGHWPCPASQRALQMLNGDEQNQVKVLPDLPDSKRRTRKRAKASDTNENCSPWAEEVDFCRRDAKGQTALHVACIRNKVERLIQLLSSPGIDINSKDYAGWTPLHEACNHGSTVCVSEILQRCPEVDLLSQVDGVTPLHDALSNGHVEIGKLLLQHGGPVLLQQRDSNGKFPLDYVQSLQVKQELLNIVLPEENIESFYEHTEKDFRSQQKELWLILFNKMLLNFCSVYNLFSPLTLSKVALSDTLPVMTADKMKGTLPAHWLVDTYFKELETFQKLPQFIEELSACMSTFPGEWMKALLATLESVVKVNQLFA